MAQTSPPQVKSKLPVRSATFCSGMQRNVAASSKGDLHSKSTTVIRNFGYLTRRRPHPDSAAGKEEGFVSAQNSNASFQANPLEIHHEESDLGENDSVAASSETFTLSTAVQTKFHVNRLALTASSRRRLARLFVRKRQPRKMQRNNLSGGPSVLTYNCWTQTDNVVFNRKEPMAKKIVVQLIWGVLAALLLLGVASWMDLERISDLAPYLGYVDDLEVIAAKPFPSLPRSAEPESVVPSTMPELPEVLLASLSQVYTDLVMKTVAIVKSLRITACCYFSPCSSSSQSTAPAS